MLNQTADLQPIYDRILRLGGEGGAGTKFLRMSKRYAEGGWRYGTDKLQKFSRPFDGGTVLEFGCKFGHLTPVFQSLGAGAVINVDVDEEYLRDGERFIGTTCSARYVKSDDCYVEIESDSVDFVLAKEVISHINPALLHTFYSEISRVLKPGGEIVISDGNNLDRPDVREGLLEGYCAWEHGTSKELGSNYEAMRGRIIAKAFPKLADDQISYYARNTSGLHGDRLIETVRRGVEEGVFTERPHRKGQLPIHPGYGTAMERGFHASDVISALEQHGFSAELLPSDDVALIVRGALS